MVILTFMPFARHLAQALAVEPWMFYLGPCFDFLGSYNAGLIRAIISTCVPKYELGKALAFMGSMESGLPIIMTQIYAWVWQVMRNFVPFLQLIVNQYYNLKKNNKLTNQCMKM